MIRCMGTVIESDTYLEVFASFIGANKERGEKTFVLDRFRKFLYAAFSLA